jgi:hypothetical protein
MGALGEPRQPGRVLRVERDVQPVARSLHENERTTRTGTKRVLISRQLGRTGDTLTSSRRERRGFLQRGSRRAPVGSCFTGNRQGKPRSYTPSTGV